MALDPWELAVAAYIMSSRYTWAALHGWPNGPPWRRQAGSGLDLLGLLKP